MKFFSVLIILATTFATVAASTVNDCKKDVSDITSHVQFLNNALETLPSNGITLNQGLTIEKGVFDLQRALDKAASDFKATPPFSSTDSQAVLKLVQSYTPDVLNLLSNLVVKKESILKLDFPGIKGLIHTALTNVHRSNDGFDDAWISSSTNEVKTQGRSIKEKTDSAFLKAEAVYSA